jgi:hypothetical protein
MDGKDFKCYVEVAQQQLGDFVHQDLILHFLHKEARMWFNPIIRWLLRTPLHFFVSKNMMLMTYSGSKSGKIYATPMNYLEVEGILYTISSRERVWWRNLRGGAQVTLRLKGKDIPAWAEALEGEALVASSLIKYLKTAPQLARYLGVTIHPQSGPDSKGVARLAREKVMVRSILK